MTPVLRTASGVLALALLFAPAHALVVADSVKINEVSYDPVANPETPSEYIELYNASGATVYLDGAVISDEGNNGSNEATFQFPGTRGGSTIPLAAHAYMLLVGDATGSPFAASADFEFYGGPGDSDDPAVPNLTKTAGLATNLYLANDGDGVTLSVGISNGNVIPCNEVVDGVSWENGGSSDVTSMSATVCADPAPSAGYTNGGTTGLMTLQRCPDGVDTDNSSADFVVTNRTPRGLNLCHSIPPDITGLGSQPCFATAGQPVTIVCNVNDANQDLVSVWLFHKLAAAASWDSLAMSYTAPDVYSALLPGAADQEWVQYFVVARDLMGNIARNPVTASALPSSYRVGLQTIQALQAPAASDSCSASSQAGKACNVIGVVTHVEYEYSANFFYIQQGTGPYAGLRVFCPVDSSFVPEFGDSVLVSGLVDEYHCQTEVKMFAGCGTVLGHKRKVRARQLVDLGALAVEENESMLVTLQGPIEVLSGFDDTNLGREFEIGAGLGVAYVGDDTFYPDGIGYSPVPLPGVQIQSITGIVAYRRVDTTTPGPRADQNIILRLEPRRDDDVNVIWTGTGEPSLDVVRAFDLRQNSPNPFHPATTLEFVVPRGGRVALCIYDARGQVVRTLIDRDFAGAAHDRARWDGRDDAGKLVPAGVYFCTLRAGGATATRKMLLLK
jgi:hypothetical protein